VVNSRLARECETLRFGARTEVKYLVPIITGSWPRLTGMGAANDTVAILACGQPAVGRSYSAGEDWLRPFGLRATTIVRYLGCTTYCKIYILYEPRLGHCAVNSGNCEYALASYIISLRPSSEASAMLQYG
jgi:hypothetical protein